MNMVEKVARAIAQQAGDDARSDWDAHMGFARVAIEAMREPQVEMIDVACAAWIKLYPAFEGEKPRPTAGDVVSASYAAMIDAALKE